MSESNVCKISISNVRCFYYVCPASLLQQNTSFQPETLFFRYKMEAVPSMDDLLDELEDEEKNVRPDKRVTRPVLDTGEEVEKVPLQSCMCVVIS